MKPAVPVLFVFLLILTWGALPRATAAAETPVANDRLVKAAFVVSFLNFVEWPPAKLGVAPAPLVIAVLGDDEFAAQVRGIAAARNVLGRPVLVKAVKDADASRTAHLVFIAGTQTRNLPAILRELATASVLTVGDTDGFAAGGVALNLYTFDRRIRIEANSTAAARSGLRLGANLMRLARIVE